MPWIADKFVPGQEDIVSGDELALNEERLISDERIIAILKRFAPVLQLGIEKADTFHGVGSNDSLANYAEIGEDELELWDGMFGVRNRIMEKVNAGRLYVPSEYPAPNALPDTQEQAERSSFSHAVDLKNRNPHARRINLDEVILVPIEPFHPDGMQLMIRPRAYMGGRGGRDKSGKQTLYNAFVSVDLKVKDRYGRWAVDHTPGTGVHSWDSGPCYSPFKVAGADVWFNTRIDREKGNGLSIKVDHPDYLMMGAEINDSETLESLSVPDDQRLRLFFWQIERFLSDAKPGIGFDFPQLTSHE